MQNLPDNVFIYHILPRLSVDTRLYFNRVLKMVTPMKNVNAIISPDHIKLLENMICRRFSINGTKLGMRLIGQCQYTVEISEEKKYRYIILFRNPLRIESKIWCLFCHNVQENSEDLGTLIINPGGHVYYENEENDDSE